MGVSYSEMLNAAKAEGRRRLCSISINQYIN